MNDYELLDFGNDRKLERFGPYVLDRPAPPATNCPYQPALWSRADARFEMSGDVKSGAQRGDWKLHSALPNSWPIEVDGLKFEVKRTDFGHVGIFPEQAANWKWIRQGLLPPLPATVLNLFAYTGGSTLAAATAGIAVTHVDAAANVVAWARRNAQQSGLTDSPIRWITEDALKFAKRELKRGHKYDGVILDPPSYGHGPKGEVWKIDQHLPELLNVCRELTGARPKLLLLTCHAPGYDLRRLAECLRLAGFDVAGLPIETGELWLATAEGRRLHSGVFARMAAK